MATKVIKTINDFPSELLSAVFLLAHEQSPRRRPLNQRAVELELLDVSRLWRQVASATPQLWTRLRIIVKDGQVVTKHTIEVYYEKSGLHLIQVEITISTKGDLSLLNGDLRSVIKHTHRWRSLTIHGQEGNVEATSVRDTLHLMLSHSFPQLRSLEVSYSDEAEYSEPLHFDATHMPLLMHVRAGGGLLNNCLLPLSKLTTLYLDNAYLSAPNTHTTLTRLAESRITHLSIHQPLCMDLDHIKTHRFKLPHLRVLIIDADFTMQEAYALNLCRMIQAPSLESLLFQGLFEDAIRDLLNFFVARKDTPPFPNLTRLGFWRCFFNIVKQPDCAFLRAVSGVTHLELIQSNPSDILNLIIPADRRAATDLSEHLLPNLEVLAINDWDEYSKEQTERPCPGILTRFLQSRSAVSRRLKRVQVPLGFYTKHEQDVANRILNSSGIEEVIGREQLSFRSWE